MSDVILDNLLDLTQEALEVVTTLRDKALSACRSSVVIDGRPDPKQMDQQQDQTHGIAW